MEHIEGLNKHCGREECLVTDPWLCVGCLGDESNDELFDESNDELFDDTN